MGSPNITITVEGHFGPKKLTRAEFKKEWTSHVGQLRALSLRPEWQRNVDKIIEMVEQEADYRWTDLSLDQNGYI